MHQIVDSGNLSLGPADDSSSSRHGLPGLTDEGLGDPWPLRDTKWPQSDKHGHYHKWPKSQDNIMQATVCIMMILTLYRLDFRVIEYTKISKDISIYYWVDSLKLAWYAYFDTTIFCSNKQTNIIFIIGLFLW